MKFSILTIFPDMFLALEESIIGRAKKNGLINFETIDIREFSKNKHKKVDDTPYGGGAGMVMTAQPIYDAYETIKSEQSKVIYLTPRGKTLKQDKVQELAKEEHLIIICGHYEGIDQRIIESIVDEEISIGDYVLTGGEIPAMALVDSVSRYVEGVLNKESVKEESFANNLLEYPQYTKPEVFKEMKVPKVLLSGNHKEILKWRQMRSEEITKKIRPDLIKKEVPK